jgi:hypothetical protein
MKFRKTLRLLVLATLALLVPKSTASAETPKAPAPAARSAMGTVAVVVAADLPDFAKQAVVFAGPLQSDEGAPRGSDLVAQMRALVAGALGPGATIRSEQVALGAAQSLGHAAKVLVYVKVESARGELRLSTDVYRVARTVWDRVKQPSPAPVAHGFASSRIDAEVRSYLAAVPLLARRVDRASMAERDVLAVACGDVDADGALELVVVSRRRVAAGRLRNGSFAALSTTPLADLSPIAPVPLREPLAGAVILAGAPGQPGAVDVGITDRAHGSRLDGKLRPVAPIAGVPFATPEGDACLGFQGTTLAPIIRPCADRDPAFAPFDVAAGADAIARVRVIGSDGNARLVEARRDPITRDVTLKAGATAATLRRSGAQIAIADLDGDGDPEIVSSLDTPPSAAAPAAVEDAVVVTSLRADGRLQERARVPVPSGVRAVAACPPDSPGPAPFVIATANELWVVR